MKLIWLLVLSALTTLGANAPIALENPDLSLRFDPQTGTCTGFTDRRTDQELVVGQANNATVAPPQPPKLDIRRIREALASERAIDLAGQWLYTPTPPKESESVGFSQGRFEGVAWAPTPIPSRRGSGDDCLHNRTGDFWYRYAFTLPSSLADERLMLVIGAVDDFDVTSLNGTRIGATDQATPHFWETPRFYHCPPNLLRRDQTNVLLMKVHNGAYDGGITGPVVLGLASELTLARTAAPPLTEHSLSRAGDAALLRLTTRAQGYEYRMELWLPDADPFFSRQLTVRNISEAEQLFQMAACATPPLSVGTEQGVLFPGSQSVGDRPLAKLGEGEWLGSPSQDPLVVLWDDSQRRGLGSWFHCEEEFSPVSVCRHRTGAEIRHSQNIIVRLKPGESVTLGRQFFWLVHGSRDETLRGVQRVYSLIGLRPPSKGLAGLGGMVIYCGHPGGPPELNYLRYGGFNAMRHYVPTLRKMGIDLLWFLPTWEHGDGQRWNLYSPFDHFQVDHLLGTAAELQQLSRTCATNGLRLMFDLVPHGPPEFTPLAKEHPEWIARTPDGQNQVMWNQLAFDNNHPGWQDYMRRAAEWGAREFGAIGARVDCGAGGPLNWNPQVSNRPSLSSLAAGLGMNRAIREGYLRIHPEVVVLPEEYTGANIFCGVADLTYDAQFYFLQADLLARGAPPEQWARAFQQFLHDQQLTLPPGALKMRWISNHDTVSWTFQKRRPAQAYGLDRMRALLALCAFIEGVPMLYQGDEDPAVYGGQGASSVEYLARIYALRKRLPALRQGVADYASVQATGGVFACLRNAKDQQALVLVSFNPESVACTLMPPGRWIGDWRDELSGELLNLKEVLTMAPYQPRVLTPAATTPNL